MVEIIPFNDDRVVGMRLEGGISKTEVDKIWDLVEDKLKRHKKLRIYVEYLNFDGIEFKALLKNIPKKIQHFSDFEREAVVSDKRWLAKFIAVGDKFFPSIEVRHFTFDASEKARYWIQSDESFE